MGKVTVKGLIARKLRLFLTALSIILGVTFVTGTLVLTDTLHNTISSLYGSIYRHIDFEVQAPGLLNIPDSILGEVRAVPGVAHAEGSVTGYAQFVAPDGTAVNTGIEPATGLSFDPNSQLSPFRLVQGSAPSTAHEVVIDQVTAQKYHFRVGNRVKILLPGAPQRFTITGIASFTGAGNLSGATFAGFALPTAQKLFGAVDQLYTIDILTKPGADKAAVRRDITKFLPSGLQVVTGQTVANQQTSTTDQSVSPLSTALLVFALIALFVGGFTIFNTFSITVGQRTRELALLRIVGASRRQIFRSVLLEVLIVGLAASLIGIGLGVLTARVLEGLLGAFGISLPSGALVFELHTVLAALLVGVGVTMVSAISPAWRAVRIAPVAALIAQSIEPEPSSRRRFIVGGAVALVAIVLLALGLAQAALALVGLGAAGIFIATGMLAPTVAGPMAGAIGRPLARVLGIAGRLGPDNAQRSPRRTAQSAAALMVGLAVVSAVAVVGASLAQASTSSVDNAISANLLVTSSSGTFSTSVPRTVARLPGVSTTCTVYGAAFEVRGVVAALKGVCTNHLADSVILRMEAGSAGPALKQGRLLIDAMTAHAKHLSVASALTVAFPQRGNFTMHVGGIFQPNALIGNYLVSSSFFRSHFTGQLPGGILIKARPGATHLERTVSRALKNYPNLTIQTRAQFEASQTAAINSVLGLVYALLALAVIIALIGVVNTLLLSVFERTREIGLLRAVGMKRRQIRIMIRTEAVILSLFGAVTGLVVGAGLGAALAYSLKQQGITTVVIPFTSLVVFLVIAALLGLAAASWPARRAAKLDVLAAIATE